MSTEPGDQAAKSKKDLTGTSPKPPGVVGDLFSPFYRVAFLASPDITTNTFDDKFVTQAVISPQIGLDPDTDLSVLVLDSFNLNKFAASLSVNIKAQGLTSFTLTLTPPYDDAIRIIDNRLIRAGSLVKVQWGYSSPGHASDILSDIFVFRSAEPKVAITDYDVTITLTGFDIFNDIYGREDSRVTYDRKVSGNETDISIVATMLIKFDFEPDFSGVLDSSRFLEFKSEPIIQSSSDWDFIRTLCYDNDVWFSTIGKTVYFHDLNFVAQQPAPYRFLWRKQLETEFDVPVISFTANPEIRAFLPPEAIQGAIISSDPNKKTLTTLILEPTQTSDNAHTGATSGTEAAKSGAGTDARTGVAVTDPQTGNSYVLQPKLKSDQTGRYYSAPSNHDVEGRVKSQQREAEFYANTTANLTAPGVVGIIGTGMIVVEGVGKSFSGPYMIRDCTHDLGTDGYTMKLDLVRSTAPGIVGSTTTNPPKPTVTGTPEIKPVSPEATPKPKRVG